MAARSLTDELE